jgi:hypothetical protein
MLTSLLSKRSKHWLQNSKKEVNNHHTQKKRKKVIYSLRTRYFLILNILKSVKNEDGMENQFEKNMNLMKDGALS